MPVALLDVNVLIALAWPNHSEPSCAAAATPAHATCPLPVACPSQLDHQVLTALFATDNSTEYLMITNTDNHSGCTWRQATPCPSVPVSVLAGSADCSAESVLPSHRELARLEISEFPAAEQVRDVETFAVMRTFTSNHDWDSGELPHAGRTGHVRLRAGVHALALSGARTATPPTSSVRCPGRGRPR
jgi:hypothetical protein